MVLAGKEYGTGSSRDWAAKGTALLGVKAVHRRELRADPPQQPGRAWACCRSAYQPGETAPALGLTGTRDVHHHRHRRRGSRRAARVQVDGPRRGRQGRQLPGGGPAQLATVEVDYYRHGGILQRVLRKFAAE